MKRLFHNYKKDYEMAVRVMGAMAEEIVRLRQENENLRLGNVDLQKDNEYLTEENGDYDEIFEAQNKTIACLHDKIRKAADILAI